MRQGRATVGQHEGVILPNTGRLSGLLGHVPAGINRHEASPRVLDPPKGRHPEEPLELPAELRRALVANRPRGAAGVVPVVGHQPPG